eukprot:SAG11_NODE_1233_length_5450_cov_5.983368_5_plen_552_part_00
MARILYLRGRIRELADDLMLMLFVALAAVSTASSAGEVEQADVTWPAAPQPTPWYDYPLPAGFPADVEAFAAALPTTRPRLWVLASEGETLGEVRHRLETTLQRTPKLASMASNLRVTAQRLAWCHLHAAAKNCTKLLPPLHDTRGVNQGAITQDRIGALAWTAVLDPDALFSADLPRSAYVARAFADLQAACSLTAWVDVMIPHPTSQCIDSGGIMSGVALGYDLFYNDFTSPQRQLIRDSILRLGVKLYAGFFDSTRGAANLTRECGTNYTFAVGQGLQNASDGSFNCFVNIVDHNFNPNCNAGPILAALAVGIDGTHSYTAAIYQMLRDATRSIAKGLLSYGPDGAWEEGPGYWQYATSNVAQSLDGLRASLGLRPRVVGLNETGLWSLYNAGPSLRPFGFGDAEENQLMSRMPYGWLANGLHAPDRTVEWWDTVLADRGVGGGLSNHNVLGIVRHNSSKGNDVSPAQAGLALARHFRRNEHLTMRSSWTDRDATWVAMKGRVPWSAASDPGHPHDDLGGFVFEMCGERWATDLGAEGYNVAESVHDP